MGQSLPEESPFEGTIRNNLTFGDPSIGTDRIYAIMDILGLQTFVQDQPQGLNTVLYPEGRQIPYTIARKIVLARSILHQPKLLVLKDPLDQFDPEESEAIMDYLTHPDRGWSLVVVSSNPRWADRCDRVLTMENGQFLS